MMTKRLEVYRAIVALAVDGVCEATQAEIAALAGVRRQHIIPILRYLEKSRMIETVNFTTRHYGARHRYLPLIESAESDSKNEIESAESDSKNEIESDSADSITRSSPQNRTRSHMIHDMNDMKDILQEFNFIHAKNRNICARLVDLATARRWRELWEYCESNEAWGEYGVTTNGVGWIVRLIKNGDPVPDPIQSPLPGGAMDLSQAFTSRGMTREEIQAVFSPTDGSTIGDDGVWR